MKNKKRENKLSLAVRSHQKIMKRFVLIGTAFAWIGCMLLGVFINQSFVQPIRDFNTLSKIVIEEPDIQTLNVEEELQALSTAQMVASVTFSGSRQSLLSSTLSQVHVDKVYAGDPSIEGKDINLFERNSISQVDDSIMLRNRAYSNFMMEGKKYIVFMNYMGDFDETYARHAKKVLPEYVVVSAQTGLFLEEKSDFNVLNKTSNQDYQQMKENEFIVFSVGEKEQLLDLKKQAFKNYNIG